MNPTFVKPHYDSHGFAGLPNTIISTFKPTMQTGSQNPLPKFKDKYDNLVFCLIDGFGWRHFEKFGSHPLLQRFQREGDVAKLTSQFPSTTAAHITCIHTGLNVGQSGILEWIYYEPLLDAVIAPLLYSYSGTVERDQLKTSGIDPRQLYPTQTLYKKLQSQSVNSTIFQHREYTPSTYSNQVFAGAAARGYKSLPETVLNLSIAVNQARAKNYFFLYYDRVDSISHDYGPDSQQVEAEVEMLMYVLEKQFFEKTRPKGRTLFLLSADHGQSEVDPSTTIYLNKIFPDITKYIKTNRKGELLVPAGSCRDMILYLKDDMLDEAQHLLAQKLEGKADVIKTADLVAQGYFGPEISATFQGHIGNLVILPYRHQSVWWYERGKFEQKFYGHHGGLTPQEMEIPLLGLEL